MRGEAPLCRLSFMPRDSLGAVFAGSGTLLNFLSMRAARSFSGVRACVGVVRRFLAVCWQWHAQLHVFCAYQ